MTEEEFAVLRAIGVGKTRGFKAETVAKLSELGLVYGDQGAAAVFLTANGRAVLERHGGGERDEA